MTVRGQRSERKSWEEGEDEDEWVQSGLVVPSFVCEGPEPEDLQPLRTRAEVQSHAAQLSWQQDNIQYNQPRPACLSSRRHVHVCCKWGKSGGLSGPMSGGGRPPPPTKPPQDDQKYN